MRIPILELKSGYLELKDEFDAAYRRFMESGTYIFGAEVELFEQEYAAYCDASFCVGVGTGLDAILLSLRALEVGPGDEVIVPSNTFIATWLAVTHSGGTIVPVDPDPATFNIDVSSIEKVITPQTKVILAVNLYGQPCDYDSILDLAKRHGIHVVIDNAQAQGARYKGRRTGGIADMECHSFYPGKNLGAFGDAGAVTTNNAGLADKLKAFRNYGSRTRYHNDVIGYNSRLDGLQAAFLRVKLAHLDEWNMRRIKLATDYLSLLPDVCSQVCLPAVPSWAEPVWHLFVIRHPERDALQAHLNSQGIGTLIHYPIPPHLSGAYAAMQATGRAGWKLPVAESLAAQVLSLPMGPHFSETVPAMVADAFKLFRSSSSAE